MKYIFISTGITFVVGVSIGLFLDSINLAPEYSLLGGLTIGFVLSIIGLMVGMWWADRME